MPFGHAGPTRIRPQGAVGLPGPEGPLPRLRRRSVSARRDRDGERVARGREGADEVIGEGARREQRAVEVDAHALPSPSGCPGPQETEAVATVPAGHIGEDGPQRAVGLDRDLERVLLPVHREGDLPPSPRPRSTPSALATRTARSAYGRKVPDSVQRGSYGWPRWSRRRGGPVIPGRSPVPPTALRDGGPPDAARPARPGSRRWVRGPRRAGSSPVRGACRRRRRRPRGGREDHLVAVLVPETGDGRNSPFRVVGEPVGSGQGERAVRGGDATTRPSCHRCHSRTASGPPPPCSCCCASVLMRSTFPYRLRQAEVRPQRGADVFGAERAALRDERTTRSTTSSRPRPSRPKEDGTYNRILKKWGTTESAIETSEISPPELK